MKNLDVFKAHGDIIWNIVNLLCGPYHPRKYRSTLITAASTGKIHVRGWQPQESNP